MTRVLWLSNETADPAGQGGQRRQYAQLRVVAKAGVQVTLVSLAGPQDHTSALQWVNVVRTRPRWGGRIVRPQHRTLLRRLAREPWDAIVMAHTESWPVFKHVANSSVAPLWVDLHNVLGQRDPAWLDVELDMCHAATRISVCSEKEKERLLQEQEGLRDRIIILPHGIDPTEWTAPRAGSIAPVVKLFGNWSWPPNAKGLQWFLEEVWPEVRVPDAWCEIAGSGVDTQSLPPRVRFVGRVPRLDTWTSDAAAVAVPVLDGLGAPVKYLEALASGAPVVSTPDGAPLARSLATLVSAEATSWARTLQDLLREPVASTGVRLVDFHWETTTRPLVEWLKRLGTSGEVASI